MLAVSTFLFCLSPNISLTCSHVIFLGNIINKQYRNNYVLQCYIRHFISFTRWQVRPNLDIFIFLEEFVEGFNNINGTKLLDLKFFLFIQILHSLKYSIYVVFTKAPTYERTMASSDKAKSCYLFIIFRQSRMRNMLHNYIANRRYIIQGDT